MTRLTGSVWPRAEASHNAFSVGFSGKAPGAAAVQAQDVLGGYLVVYALTGAVGVLALAVTLTLRPVRGTADGAG